MTPDKNDASGLARRQFLKRSGAAAAAAFGFPTIIPASALGKGGRPAPSERINLACFGYGTIASYVTQNFLNDPRVQIVAIADPVKDLPHYGYGGEKQGGREVGKKVIEEHYAKEAPKGGYSGCKIYNDFRELMEKEDYDAVQISTPDHWHAYLTVKLAEAGKHIYGQKPLALTVGEGRAMSDAIAASGVTWQTGSQQRSDVYFRQAAEFIRNNRLGKLKPIQVGLPAGHKDFSLLADQKDVAPVPEGMDFDLWTGPAPFRDYRPALAPLNWRWNFDYSGGQLTDWGAHHIDIVHWALDMDKSGPVELTVNSMELPDPGDLYNTATKFNITYRYADGNTMVVGNDPDIPQGIRFEGEEGKSIFVKRGTIQTDPADLRRTGRIQDGEIKLYESKQHEKNFIDCVYSGEPTAAPIEAAHRTISVAHIGNIAMRLGRSKLAWDPAKEQFVDDTEANKMLTREMRKPWAI